MPNAVTAVILAATSPSPTPSPAQRPGKPEVHGVFGFGSIVFFIFAMGVIVVLVYANSRRNREDLEKHDAQRRDHKDGGVPPGPPASG